jgi:HlyD family secretion protein
MEPSTISIPKKRKRKIWRFVLAGLALLIVTPLILNALGIKGEKKALEIEVGSVVEKDIVETVTGSGIIESREIVKISPDVSGEIIGLYVNEGDTIKQGQLLARIRPDNYQSLLERATAQVNAQRAALAQAKALRLQSRSRLQKAQADFTRNKILYDQKVITEAEYLGFQATLEVAQQEVSSADENIKAASFNIESSIANLKDAQENLRKTIISSPINGVVVKKSVEKGERVVGTSQMAGTSMLTIAQMDKIRTTITINENDVLKIQLGDTADVQVDAYDTQSFKGIVASIAQMNEDKKTADAITEYQIRINLLPSKLVTTVFKNGMSASASIRTNRAAKVLTVPISSVVFIEDTTQAQQGTRPAGKEIVFADSSGFAKQFIVTTGISDFTNIEVKTGLKKDQKIITGPYTLITKELKKGDKVKPKEVEPVKKLK